MGDLSVVADVKRYRETVREHTALKKLEASAKRYFKLLDDIEGAELMLADPDLDDELRVEAQSEVEELRASVPDAEKGNRLWLFRILKPFASAAGGDLVAAGGKAFHCRNRCPMRL